MAFISKHIRILSTAALLFAKSYSAGAHEVYFCGEAIPVQKDFVAHKLINVIRTQLPGIKMGALRQKALRYFPVIEDNLRRYNIPDDFKYLPIVESGFANLTSRVGAQGFWQLMPETARDFNLVVSNSLDERNDPVKATVAACKFILQTFNILKARLSQPSWILTAAAYNFGPGNILKTARQQGSDYFSMSLNNETAEYVYKIIAVKELFENPELYLGDLGVNIFNDNADMSKLRQLPVSIAQDEFKKVEIQIPNPAIPKKVKPIHYSYVEAHIIEPKKFYDGGLVSLQLDGDVLMPSSFIGKKNIIRGTGWIIDDRVYVNMGYGHNMVVIDGSDNVKGVKLADIEQRNKKIILKIASGQKF